MKIDNTDFDRLVERALQNSDLSHMRPVIEKELLHYDILFCLDKADLLDGLVFQGGTSLRLCYGGNRFSEDLDFAGGENYSSKNLAIMKQVIEDYVGERYSLEVTVREPSSLNSEPNYSELNIDKWQIAIVTSPERKDLPKQRIKIEVANVEAYTRSALPLKKNYDFLPDGYEDTLVFTETLDELMADKLVSLPATQKYVRYRDIWDLTWLGQQGAVLNAELVSKKIVDYKLTNFEILLDQRISSLPDIISSAEFSGEMKRFLPANVYDRTLAKSKFISYLHQTMNDLLIDLRQQLYRNPKAKPGFIL